MRRTRLTHLVALAVVLGACGGSDHFITRTFVGYTVGAMANLQRGDLGPGILAVDSKRHTLFVSMGCPDECSGEGVWILNPSLDVLHKVRLRSGCSRTQSAPALAVDEASGSAVVGSCARASAWVVSPNGRTRTMRLPFTASTFTAGATGIVYAADGRQLAAIAIADGRVIWRSHGNAFDVLSSNGRLFASDGDHLVTQIDPTTGRALRAYSFRGRVDTIQATRRFLFARTAGRTSIQRVRLSDARQLANVTLQALSATFLVDEERGLLWIPGKGDYEGSVLVIDIKTMGPRTRAELGKADISWMTLDMSTGQLFAEGDELERVDAVKTVARGRPA